MEPDKNIADYEMPGGVQAPYGWTNQWISPDVNMVRRRAGPSRSSYPDEKMFTFHAQPKGYRPQHSGLTNDFTMGGLKTSRDRSNMEDCFVSSPSKYCAFPMRQPLSNGPMDPKVPSTSRWSSGGRDPVFGKQHVPAGTGESTSRFVGFGRPDREVDDFDRGEGCGSIFSNNLPYAGDTFPGRGFGTPEMPFFNKDQTNVFRDDYDFRKKESPFTTYPFVGFANKCTAEYGDAFKEREPEFGFAKQREEEKESSADLRDYQCGICWELLARPVTLDCGFTFCESCIALILSRAWDANEHGAKCPMLGGDCQSGLVRKLPQLNIMVHNELRRLHRKTYEERLAEVDTLAVRRLVKTVRDCHVGVEREVLLDGPARGFWKVPATNEPMLLLPARDGGAKLVLVKTLLPPAWVQWLKECRVEADGQLVRPGVHFDELLFPFQVPDGGTASPVRMVLDSFRRYMDPFCQVRLNYFGRHVLPLAFTALVMRCVPGSGEYKALGNHNIVSWMLVPCAGLTWRGLGSIKMCSARGYFSSGEGGLLTSNVLEDLAGFRLMPWRWLLQAKIAADMGSLQHFFCTLMLIQSILTTFYGVLWVLCLRVKQRRDDRQNVIRILLSEFFLLLLNYITAEFLSFLMFLAQLYAPFRCMLVYRWTWLTRSTLVNNIFYLYGWRALFFGLSLDPLVGWTLDQELAYLKPRSFLERVLLDPAAALFICDTSFSVSSISAQAYQMWGPLRLRLLERFYAQ